MPKQRPDVLLVERNLRKTRQQAQRVIRAGEVKVNKQVVPITKVLSALHSLLQPPREVVLLVKPQFEVGRDRCLA